MKQFNTMTIAKMRRAIERKTESAGTGRVTLLAGMLVLALFWLNHFDLSGRQQATRQDLATVSTQAKAIASTQAAIDNNKNSFSTGNQLTISDIQNKADYKGEGYALSASVGFSAGNQGD